MKNEGGEKSVNESIITVVSLLKENSEGFTVHEIAQRLKKQGKIVQEPELLKCLNQAVKENFVEQNVIPLSTGNDTSVRYKPGPKKVPPKWLFAGPIVEDFDYSRDLRDWIYYGIFYEAPLTITCTHKGTGEPSEVLVRLTAHNYGDPHGIGKCEICGRIYWFEIKRRK